MCPVIAPSLLICVLGSGGAGPAGSRGQRIFIPTLRGEIESIGGVLTLRPGGDAVPPGWTIVAGNNCIILRLDEPSGSTRDVATP